MDECIDIFDENFNLVGKTDKSLAHNLGLWHQTFHCWIIRSKSDKHYVIFQKRAKQKADSPLLYDISAAGHLKSGEYKEDGIREIKEELGVDILPDQLIYLGIRVSVYNELNLKNKEFNHVFLLEDTRELDEYIINEEELEGLIEVELEDGFKLFTNKTESIMCNSISIKNGIKVRKIIMISQNDFIKRMDSYYLKVFIMADRYFRNIDCLCI